MKTILLTFLILLSSIGFSQINSERIPDSLTLDYIPMLKAGSCGSPDGTMNSIPSPPPSYNWLENNGYCYLNSYGNNPTVCWTFTPSSSSVTINSGYSQTGCVSVSFGSFNLYNSSCTLIGTGLNFTGLVVGQTYTWCMSASATGGGPSCIGFTSFCPYFMNNSTLPIELILFDGKNENNHNILFWSTATEANNDYFTLERSSNGYEFETIGTVAGAGNSSSRINYDFTDYNPKNDLNYYRLSQTDYDGRNEVFNIIVINNKPLKKKLVKIVNMLGVEVNETYDGIKVFIYEDGSVIKKM